MFAFEQSGRRSTTGSVGGHGQIQEELRYTTEPDEVTIESPVMRDMQYASLMTQEQQRPQRQQQRHVDDSSPVWYDERRHADNIDTERPQFVQPTERELQEKPAHLDINKSAAVCFTTLPPSE